MLIPSDGEGVGSITAGCLEDEVLRLADRVLETGQPRVETFDLMGDDDVWGLGVGCNGIIDLLLEPVDETYEPLLDAYEADEPSARLTVLESDAPDIETWHRAHCLADGDVVTTTGTLPEWFHTALADPATRLADDGNADTVEFDSPEGRVRVFVDGIAPPPKLLLVGTGHDVSPAVEFGNKNDFRTIVVGFRGAQATAERFPEADEVISTSPSDIREVVDIDESTYAVVMTHNFIDDRLAVDELIQSPTPYVGLMGPRERFEEMVDEFEAENRSSSQAEFEKVHTPIGLDLGGGTPYQIAHSIVAEVLAVHNDRRPRHLKEREGPIHDRVDANTP
jgi:xanthine dehydrogenase accessory factor